MPKNPGRSSLSPAPESPAPEPEPVSTISRAPLLPALWLGLSGCAFVCLFILFATRTAAALVWDFTHPGDNAFPESCIILAVKWAADGEPVYRSLEGLPVAPMLYGPLTYYIPGWMGRWAGDTSPEGLRFVARAWSLFCFVAAGLVLAEVAATLRRREGRPKGLLVPALAASLFWVFAPIPLLAATTRPDAPYLLLELLTIRFLMAFDERDGSSSRLAWGLVGLGALILLTASIRQIVLGPPATICLWLLARGRWKTTLAFCVLVPAGGVALLMAGERALGGHLIENIIKAGVVEYRLSFMREHFEQILGFLLLLTVPATFWSVRAWSRGKNPPAFSIYPIAALPFAFLLAGKKGSAIGYYWETLAAAAPGAALAFESATLDALAWWRQKKAETPPPAEAILLAMCVMLSAIGLGALAGNNLLGMRRGFRLKPEHVEAEVQALQSVKEPVAALPLRWASLLAGSDFVSADLFQHDLVVTAGQITWEPVVRALQEKRYPALLVDEPVLREEKFALIYAALLANYALDPTVQGPFGPAGIWRPKQGL